MFFRQFLTNGLVQFSYIVGSGGEAFVIDPIYDIDLYLKTAQEENLRITHVFETHRNEDMLSGGKQLAEVTGAIVHRSKYEDPGYQYGNTIGEEDVFQLPEGLALKPIHTPGHTLGHLCYVLEVNGTPYLVFTGDALFFGGVGRTDFYGEDALEEMTAKLHHSIYQKLAPLGPHVAVMPAHGSGSACGAGMDERPCSTIGFELKNSSVLSENLGEFLKINAKMLYKNPVFNLMEVKNLEGGGIHCLPRLKMLDNPPEDAVVIDLRERKCFLSTHLPHALSIPAGLIPIFTGWFVDNKDKIVLMTDKVSPENVELAVGSLLRQGFDKIVGALGDGTLSKMELTGKELSSLKEISAEAYLNYPDRSQKTMTLDVRQDVERDPADPLINRYSIPYQELKSRANEIPQSNVLFVLCGSGERGTVAASFLKSVRKDLNPVVIAGGIQSLNAVKEERSKAGK